MQRIVSAQNVLPAAISRMEEALGWLRWLKAGNGQRVTAKRSRRVASVMADGF